MRVERTFSKRCAGFHFVVVLDEQTVSVGPIVSSVFFCIVGTDPLAFLFLHTDTPAMLGDDLRIVQSCQHITNFDFRLVLDCKLPVFGQAVFITDEFTVLNSHFANIGIFFRLVDVQGTTDLCDNSFTLWHLARFENFLHTWETRCNISTGCSPTASVEGTQSQLSTRFTNGLRGDDANSRTKLNHVAARQVESVAFGTNPML